MSSQKEVVDSLNNKFNKDASAGLVETFQFKITDGTNFYLDINDGALKIIEGETQSPSVTLIMNTETFSGIMNNEIDGMQAFMSGSLKAEGNIMLATRLGDLFI